MFFYFREIKYLKTHCNYSQHKKKWTGVCKQSETIQENRAEWVSMLKNHWTVIQGINIFGDGTGKSEIREETGQIFPNAQIHLPFSNCRGLHHSYRRQRLGNGIQHPPSPLHKGRGNAHIHGAFPAIPWVVTTATPNNWRIVILLQGLYGFNTTNRPKHYLLPFIPKLDAWGKLHELATSYL